MQHDYEHFIPALVLLLKGLDADVCGANASKYVAIFAFRRINEIFLAGMAG
jgi:hypothetical protein